MQDPIFRLFISSTFADFRHEREALHQRVFPQLDAYCRARGARFDVVDLRWGVSPEAQEDLRTLSICLTEVERCRLIGLAPHFVALVGDRYGWEPAPVEIAGAQWRAMMRRPGPDRALLEAYYRADHNAIPPVWTLRRDAYAKADEAGRAALTAAVRRLAREIGLAPDDHPAIFASATHQEIAGGLLRTDRPQAGMAYLRTIHGLPQSAAGAPYVDVVDGAVDAGAQTRLAGLKATLRATLANERVRTIEAAWAGDDIAADHIEGFCAQFLADHTALIDQSLTQAQTLDAGGDAHAAFARDRARLFVGRRSALARILGYARPRAKPNRRARMPLVIEGAGGLGKSALLARAAERLQAEAGDAIVLTRFVGAVAGSEDLAGLLSELAGAIAMAQGGMRPAPPGTPEEAASAFADALSSATAQRPLAVFIDALDQLASGDRLRLLDWLPNALPPHARVILSTRPGPIAQEARRRFAGSCMRLTPMPAGDATAMLDRLLADAGRRITRRQRAEIRRASPGLPLWTRLAFEEARRWRSHEPGRRLERTVDGLIRSRITDLAEPANHGAPLVRDALGAIAASRFGLSDSELALALSQARAPEVWAAFRARSFHPWDQPVLPAIVWLRLRADLAAYLVESRIDGALTYRFFHREFADAAAAMTLTDGAGPAMHARLADVFAAPAGSDLYRACDAAGTQDSRALRRVMEQPWQLAAAGRVEALTALLDDVGFVAAKCAANRVADLMQDIARLETARAAASSSQTPAQASQPGQTAARQQIQGADDVSAAWRWRLRAWRTMLEHADARWPAHRVMFQLLLEADPTSMPQRAQACALLTQAPPDWPVLVCAAPQRYVAPLVEEAPATPDLAGVAPLSGGYLALWDHMGGLRILDRRSAELVERFELGAPKSARAHLARLAARFGAVETIFEVAPRRGPGSRQTAAPTSLEAAQHGLKLSWPWDGCLAVKTPGASSEIILGKEEISLIGETSEAVYFLCDGRILVAGKARLAALPAGLYAYGGLCIEGLAIAGDDGGWTHERFNSVVFVSPEQCLTLGFSGRGGQRDDVILEMYKIGQDGVARIGYGVTDHDLDLPIWHICGLSDGSIILASEHYWHTFIWSPPFDGDSTVCLLAGAAVGNNHEGNWINLGDKEGHLTFEPSSPSLHVSFDAPGVYGSYGGDHHACPGVTHIDADDHSAMASFTGFEATTPDGVMMRWHCDVRAHWIFARDGGAAGGADRGADGGDYVVFKNSGPVRVVRWRG
jgi:hypothetical protein